ncbi:hypothetical protein ACFLWA_12550 [Chloroflexota bacterium]
MVSAWIQNAASGEFVGGLLLETLQQLAGPASFSTAWDTTSSAAGAYAVVAELRTPGGLLLDQQVETFQTGMRQAQVLNLVATPQSFLPGATVHLDVDLKNTGTVPISATVTLDIHAPSAGVLRSFSLPSPVLSPDQVTHLQAEWNTQGLDPGAYADYGSAATNVLTAQVTAFHMVCLPLVKH